MVWFPTLASIIYSLSLLLLLLPLLLLLLLLLPLPLPQPLPLPAEFYTAIGALCVIHTHVCLYIYWAHAERKKGTPGFTPPRGAPNESCPSGTKSGGVPNIKLGPLSLQWLQTKKHPLVKRSPREQVQLLGRSRSPWSIERFAQIGTRARLRCL